ncbi:hypothetical protein EPN27_03260, partial [Patescibacteria group bacterium]
TSGTQSVSPTSAQTYNLSCTGAGGTTSQSVNLAVTAPTTGDIWASKTGMPGMQSMSGAVSINNRVYVIGGNRFSDIPSVYNYEYDPATNTWATKTGMPTARSGAFVATVNNKIYVIGGYGWAGVYYTTNEEYNPATNTWATKTGMPTARAYGGVAVANGKIYAMGGKFYAGTAGYIQTIYAGDITITLTYYPGGSDVIVSSNEEYDPATDTWAIKTSMPVGKTGIVSSSANNKIYVIGGYYQANSSTAPVYYNTRNEEYDPVTNLWTIKADRLTQGTSSNGAVSVNNKIYVIGGTTNEEYDPIANTWTLKASIPTWQWAPIGATVNNKAYIFDLLNSVGYTMEYTP